MNSKAKTAIVIAIIIVILVGLGILKIALGGQAKVPDNDPYEVGNSAGNLYNNGLFSEKNGIVYFANAYDDGALYSMNADQTNIKKLATGTNSFINVLGNYIYYYSATSGDRAGLGYVRNGRGIYRTSIDGKNTFSMAKITTDGMIGIGNNIYFNNFADDTRSDNAIVTMESVTTANENQHTVLKDHVAIGGYYSGNLYYGAMTDTHALFAINTLDESIVPVSNEWFYLPIIEGGNVYYIDTLDNYHLKKISLSDNQVTTLVDERVDFYNIYNGIIYYQNAVADGYALKRINSDGSGMEVVANGVYRDINITSSYVYFRAFENDLPVYCQSTFGSVNVTTFDAALAAVLAN